MKFIHYYASAIILTTSVLQTYSKSHIDLNDSISFFKISQAVEGLDMKQLLINQESTDYALTIIAEAQQLPSFALVLKHPENDEYWFEFQDDLTRLKTKHEALYRNKGIIHHIKSVLTRTKKSVEDFKDALAFQEIITKVDMNFFLLRTIRELHKQTKQYNAANN
jgi:hypothetical protein